MIKCLGDHPYIKSAHFWYFSDPPTHSLIMSAEQHSSTVLKVSKNGHCPNRPTKSFCWRNIGMVPWSYVFFVKTNIITCAMIQSICMESSNGILFPKLVWPSVRKNCSSVWEFFWNLRLKVREFAKFFRSLEQFVPTVKAQNNFC